VYGEGQEGEEGEDGMLPSGFMDDMADALMPGEIQMVTTKVIASVVKPDKDTKLGIKFSLKFDQHFVEKIEKGGIFGGCSELQVGQRVVSVKGEYVRSASIEDAIIESKHVGGRITLETTDGDFGESDEIANNLRERLIIHFEKPKEKGRLGVGFQKRANNEGIGVVGVSKEGFLAGLNILAVGDKVVGINGKPCPDSTEDLVGQIVAAEGMFSLELSPVKRDKDFELKRQEKDAKELKRKEIEVLIAEVGPPVIALVDKPARNCKVGISLRKSLKIDSILIAAIADDGLLYNSELRVGQKIVSINNTPCPTNTISAIKLIKGTPPGPLRLEACEIDWSATLAKTNPEGDAAITPAITPAAPEAVAPEAAPANEEPEKEEKGEGEGEGDEMQDMLDDFEAQLQDAYDDLNLDYDSADSSAVGDDQSFATGIGSTYIEHGK
jgi:C-terminal processing protease CtpA/Prc